MIQKAQLIMTMMAAYPRCHYVPIVAEEGFGSASTVAPRRNFASKQLSLVSFLLTCKLYAKKAHAVIVDVHIDSSRYPADPACPGGCWGDWSSDPFKGDDRERDTRVVR